MRERLRSTAELMEGFAVMAFHRAAQNLGDAAPSEDEKINPYAVSLDPDRWEADGLYSDDGISYVQALEMLPGIEEMDLEARGAVVAA